MKRLAYAQLVAWKNRPDSQRKPLIIEGARQTGKTWLAEEFGRREFENMVRINFEDAVAIRNIFEMDFNIDRILLALQAYSGEVIRPGKTLLFFDEIQFARRGLLSLKYFRDKAPQYHVVAAGSLLGVLDHEDDSFPVGKVAFLPLYPLCFEEFLEAIGQEGLVSLLHAQDWEAITAFGEQLTDLLRQYYYVGGMPEAVRTFAETHDYQAVREVQEQLLRSYRADFSKHPPKEIVARMHLLWESIPAQLAKENKRFVYSAVRGGARAKDFETAIAWLCNAGMIYRLPRITQAELPLSGFVDPEAFKLYLLDVGLLGAMNKLDARTLLDGPAYFAQYKGALTEQFVLQELRLWADGALYYWSPEQSIAELDFVVQDGGTIIPIEAKAERNLRAKSLGQFLSRYPAIHRAIRTSLSDYQQGEKVVDLPLYALSLLRYICQK